MLSDYHMHFEYGEYDEEWVKLFFEQAEKMGLKEIGITEHSHGFVEFKDMYYDELILDNSEIGKFQQKWLDNPKSKFVHTLDEYANFIQMLKDKGYPVKFGIEICNFKNQEKVKQIIEEAKVLLTQENKPYSNSVQLGIMVETPAAAVMSPIFAKHVDFFSIGTNDLTQYTLAIDRQNNRLDRFYNPHHEAVLRMIQMTVDGAHKHGKWVGICGELGADTTLTTRFVQMGIDELSVAPSMVLNVRSKICEME